jgi:hypothetical protein
MLTMSNRKVMAKQVTDDRIPVSRRALIQRINRKLPGYKTLKTTRGLNGTGLGRHYIIDEYNNSITRVDPEKLGRELGVLRGYERVAD